MLLFSDPHLGLVRQSHTTPASRVALSQIIFSQVLGLLAQPGPRFCLGDLFDRFSNPESVILQGLQVANDAFVLAGNHDSSNRENVLSSLAFLQSFQPGNIITQPKMLLEEFYCIPHVLTQTEFEHLLDTAPAAPVLCLHCNYASPFAQNESTLNLTREKAEKLLARFNYILIGHEHNERSDFDGRVQMLGCTFPTSFSDTKTDKYQWDYTAGKLTRHVIWSQSRYVNLPWQSLLDGAPVQADAQFLEVTGTAPLNALPDIAKKVSETWQRVPGLLMLRNAATAENTLPDVEFEPSRFLDLPTRIRAELPADLIPLWESYL